MQIEAESAGRLAESGDESIATRLVVMHFESPSLDGAKRPEKAKTAAP